MLEVTIIITLRRVVAVTSGRPRKGLGFSGAVDLGGGYIEYV